MLYDLTKKVSYESLDELQKMYEESKNKIYEKPFEEVYVDYQYFIKKDLCSLIFYLINNQQIELENKSIQIKVNGSLYEGIRLKWLEMFFKDNNLGSIQMRSQLLSETQFDILFGNRVTIENIIEACKKEIPSLKVMKESLKRNSIDVMKEELELQRKKYNLNDNDKILLKKVFPGILFDSKFISYKMLVIVYNILLTNDIFNNIEDPNITVMGIEAIYNKGISIDNISLLTGIPYEDVQKCLDNKQGYSLKRD